MSSAKSRGAWKAVCQDSRHNTHPGRKEDIILVDCGPWKRVSQGMGALQEVKIHAVSVDIPPDSYFLLGLQNVGVYCPN